MVAPDQTLAQVAEEEGDPVSGLEDKLIDLRGHVAELVEASAASAHQRLLQLAEDALYIVEPSAQGDVSDQAERARAHVIAAFLEAIEA